MMIHSASQFLFSLSAPVKPRRLALLTMAVISFSAMAADSGVKLQTGLAIFALASGEPASALHHTRNLTDESAALIRARALLATGNIHEARGLLDGIIEGTYHRGEAALIQARLAMANGERTSATGYLQTAARLGHGETRQEALYHLAEEQRRAGHGDRAGKVLASMEEGYWAALGYMNIAADYANRDLDPARALVALRVALAMSEGDTDSQRSQDLRDQLLLRAGFLSYQHEEYEKALGFLERVSLDSYRTPRALYVHGLALAARNNHRAAMQSWHRAKKFPLAYPGVADAWIGMGRGYDLAGYLGQAGEAYLAANASYESERVTLRKLATQVKEKGAYQALVRDARHSDAEWFLADSRTLTQPRNAYLLRFMEESSAQQAVQRVAELDALSRELQAQQNTLEVFRDSIRSRLATPATASVPDRLQERLEKLSGRLVGLQEQTPRPESTAELRTMTKTLSDLQRSIDGFAPRMEARNRHLEGLLQQTQSALQEISRLEERLVALRARAEKELNDIALAFVAREDQRMVHVLDRTEQQIAHLYEYLALQNLERGEP